MGRYEEQRCNWPRTNCLWKGVGGNPLYLGGGLAFYVLSRRRVKGLSDMPPIAAMSTIWALGATKRLEININEM